LPCLALDLRHFKKQAKRRPDIDRRAVEMRHGESSVSRGMNAFYVAFVRDVMEQDGTEQIQGLRMGAQHWQLQGCNRLLPRH
jgi:hypothetical protein